MPTWPTTLPQEPSNTPFQESPPNLVIRSEMDAGPAKVRKRFTAAARPFEVEYHFTSDQMDIWESFYEDEISDGAVSFLWPHPRKLGTFITVRLVPISSAAMMDYEHLGAGAFRVAMKMEQLP